MGKLYGFLLTVFLLCSSCTVSKINAGQGISGKVLKASGNRMPSPGVASPFPQGIKTKIYVYELTNISQVARKGQSPFYTTISTKLIQELESASDGGFMVNLPPGNYSLFTKVDVHFYANTFDDKNNIAPVEVRAGKMTTINILVDNDAVY